MWNKYSKHISAPVIVFEHFFLFFRIWNSKFNVYWIYLPNTAWKDTISKIHDICKVTFKNKKPNCTGQRSRLTKMVEFVESYQYMRDCKVWNSCHIYSVLLFSFGHRTLFHVTCYILQYFLSMYLYNATQKQL